MQSQSELIVAARDLLARHGYPASNLEFLGSGEQSACYGSGQVAVLLGLNDPTEPPDLLGHVIWTGTGTIVRNDYSTLQKIIDLAADGGVQTPRILAVGDAPRSYAVIERAQGTPATDHPDLATQEMSWFDQLGGQVGKTNQVRTTGFGMFAPDGSGQIVGCYPTWPDFLNAWMQVYLCVGDARPEDARVLDFLLSQHIVSESDLARVAAGVRSASSWTVDSVLTHYDNRLNNLVINNAAVTMLDWDLSCAGIGLPQEMIKLFESGPASMDNPRVAAFLHGYGLSDAEADEAIDAGKLMLVMDGLAMSHGWVDQPYRLGGVRGWLQTVRNISSIW
ncbi:phosphotransferase [Microlunatus sp. Gsoil 973]|uniref:phosphotransferase n=1 Tax=Microlunatus sp. Gsoil 973 TaxID=2672569 RepID=UPI0012B4C6F9|nr:phosphotransferase [Microlunatus sp. Gsoil 973]QGN34416.1 hypothetical protein GJV80_18120 [Microlunatus sp. Gsoil 973]